MPGNGRVRHGHPRTRLPGRVLEFPAGTGVITALDSTGLVRWAAQRDCVAVLEFGLGDFRVEGDRMAVLWGLDDLRASSPSDLAGELAEFVGRSGEPDLATDFSYRIRHLTDIAKRALSLGRTGPFTYFVLYAGQMTVV